MPDRPGWFDPGLMPFPSHWLEWDGHTLHYVDEGSGPTLLMVHGNPSWSFLYRRMIPALSDRFRCVALDHPGYGLSRARGGYGFTAAEHSEVLRGFVAALDLTGITPVAQDWGGPIALGAAVAEPARYTGLVLGNTWAWPSNLWTRAFGTVMGGPVVGPLLSQRLNLFAGQMLPRMMRRRTLTARERAMYGGPFRTAESRAPARILASQISGAGPFLRDLEARLPAISGLPSLLLWATGDIAFGEGERARWQQVLTDRTDHTLDGAGHFWPDDAAEEATDVIGAWLADRGTG